METGEKQISIAEELLFKSLICGRVTKHFTKTNWLHYKDYLEMVRVSMLEAKKLK